MTSEFTDISMGVTIRVGKPDVAKFGKGKQMMRILKFTIALALGVALVSPILSASPASACHYTSQDKAKGYKC